MIEQGFVHIARATTLQVVRMGDETYEAISLTYQCELTLPEIN
jgi:hypothetical protein